MPAVDFMTAIRTCFSKYVDFSGRARRSEFWFFMLFNVAVQIVASLIDGIILGGMGILGLVASLGLLVPALAVSVRRLHDSGRSGWWILIGLIPLVGIILLIVWYVNKGEDGPNRFGANPRMLA